ncbi:ADP-ribosylglycohydrolase family protein [Persicirhabdus sediminis]|uniref:ADP-ribosylglycohydrolase family protein n=1 Tax=Persicirhabdus sediminis TaxID=454144 RepID=A0A8J7SKB5_9BACT|nr:ADP-ribosylglycohydrolase family protein [Persicirhabdus sediminis]MBK1789693.1 ADP-ribosylglycohydrolase family protein [Persicirhabdus sediminis]
MNSHHNNPMTINEDKVYGILLGTAVGDTLGLPSEGLKPAMIRRLGWHKNLKQRFILGRGMWSDDTEHTIMLSQAWLKANGEVEKCSRNFSWQLRAWLFGFPSGVGLATAKSLIKLCLGYSAKSSGVYSAGNGPAMRAAIVAACSPDNKEIRYQLTKSHTETSHTDPRALISSLAVCEIAALFLQQAQLPTNSEIIELLENITDPISDEQAVAEWQTILLEIKSSLASKHSFDNYLSRLLRQPKNGISGYTYETVPAVIYIGLYHQWKIEPVIRDLIAAGGDTDSTAAIAGALCGAAHGAADIPASWSNHIAEFPCSAGKLAKLSEAITSSQPMTIRPSWSPMLLLRNLLFFFIVLVHIFLRPLLYLKSLIHKQS